MNKLQFVNVNEFLDNQGIVEKYIKDALSKKLGILDDGEYSLEKRKITFSAYDEVARVALGRMDEEVFLNRIIKTLDKKVGKEYEVAKVSVVNKINKNDSLEDMFIEYELTFEVVE